MSQFKIYYIDKDIVVCHKPIGVSSQDDGQNSVPALIRKETGKEYIGIIHRLDTAVGGVMVYALNSKSAAFLSKQVADGVFKKQYLAVVHGVPEIAEGRLEDFLFKDSKKNKSFVVKKERKGVKYACLDYEVLKVYDNGTSLVRVNLITGRTHQIRVQFASRKHPLVGDGKYGAVDNEKNIRLLCKRIEFFKSPADKNASVFESSADF